MSSYSAEDLEAWRNWSRLAPIEALSDFLGDVDAGETELHVLDDRGGKTRRFIIEVHPLEEEKK